MRDGTILPKIRQDFAAKIPKEPFVRLTLKALRAVEPDSATLAMFALLCQASVQNCRVIVPNPSWPNIVGLPERSWRWALASLESGGLIRRDGKQIELVGALADAIPGRRVTAQT